ncbi:MAG: hypothetical protein ACTSQJ_06775 [Promethearchaeota archaeon]
MHKTEYIYMIVDNILAFNINLPPELQGNNLNEYLNQYDEKILGILAGFNKILLEHFLIVSKRMNRNELELILKKMEKISHMVGPTGNLNYLGSEQIEYLLKNLEQLKFEDITEEKVSLIADELLEKQFGTQTYDQNLAFENQLASAKFYLIEMGYSNQEIEEKLDQIRQDPSKLDAIFNIPRKEIYSLPPELEQGGAASSTATTRGQQSSIDQIPGMENILNNYIQQIQRDHPPERAQKVADILDQIKAHVREQWNDNYEQVYRQMHPDRLKRIYKELKSTKRKSKRMPLLLEWYFCSHLIENIEFKVEHWQVSSSASHGRTGVYTAGILFSRYDPIIREFSDGKLAKVVNITRRILRTPSKKVIQKLGQDLVAETGFDEHLYFTD